MENRTLSGTDLEVSRTCLGTMTFGQQADQCTANEIVKCCFEAGINFFDTANIYSRGKSEEILGKALKGHRTKLVLASKVGMTMGEGAGEGGLSRPAVLAAIDQSLRRLQTDYLDIYYLHQPDYSVPIEETLEVLDELVRSGRVRYAATSNYASWQVCQILGIAERNRYAPATIAQPMYNLLARGIEQEFAPMAKALGVSMVVYNPLAGGMLTGKQSRSGPLPGTRFELNPTYVDRYWHPAFFDAVEKLSRAAQGCGRSLISVALNWLLHHSPADVVILGASRLEQLRDNLSVMNDGPLCRPTLAACDQLWTELKGVTPKYNR